MHKAIEASEQIGLEEQDLPRTYLARHELESVTVIIIIVKASVVSASLVLSEGPYPHHTLPSSTFSHTASSSKSS